MLKQVITWKSLVDEALLVLRLTFGLLMAFAHGLPKLNAFSDRADSFPDPLGVGSTFSLILVIFAELICALAVSLGLLTRFALIPLMLTMIVAVFVIHGEDPFNKQELGIVYLLAYAALFLSGPGRYSLDRKIFGSN